MLVRPSTVRDGRFGLEPQASLGGVCAQCSGDLGPPVVVGAGVVDQLGQPALGLLDEAGDQGDVTQIVSEPDAAAIGESGDGVVDEVEGVLAGAWIILDGHRLTLRPPRDTSMAMSRYRN